MTHTTEKSSCEGLNVHRKNPEYHVMLLHTMAVGWTLPSCEKLNAGYDTDMIKDNIMKVALVKSGTVTGIFQILVYKVNTTVRSRWTMATFRSWMKMTISRYTGNIQKIKLNTHSYQIQINNNTRHPLTVALYGIFDSSS